MEPSSKITDCFDEIPKLEAKVVYAMSRLQKCNESSSNSRGNFPEISSQEIVDYLTANNRYLDGDIESQVITALLSCVKSGIICAQDNGKYRLVGPNPRLMTSNCLTRSSHGSKCSCLNMINFMSKVNPNNCCTLNGISRKSAKKVIKKILKRKSAAKAKSKKKSKGQKKSSKIKKSRCIQKVGKKLFETKAEKTDEGKKNGKKKKKCEYCLAYHQKVAETKVCKKCFPPGVQYGVPSDKFSPREELM